MEKVDFNIQTLQGSHISKKVLVLFFKIPGLGKSWKNILDSHAFF